MNQSDEKEQSPREGQYELFVTLFARYESDIRRFVRSLLPTWTDTDDVVQQTAIVIWRKFDQYDPETHFMKWVCVIARFEALAYRRKMARDRLVFREDVLDLMAAEGAEEISEGTTQQRFLDVCLSEMAERQRKFLTTAYTPGVNVKKMAEEAGSTAAAFYMRLKRLRRKLLQCIETKRQQSGGYV